MTGLRLRSVRFKDGYTADGLGEAFASAGVAGLGGRFGGVMGGAAYLPGIFTHQLAIAAYMASGMMRKVISIPADDRVREWRDWQADAKMIEKIEAEERRLDIVAKVQEAELLRGIGGGALVIITAGKHDEELTAEQVSEGGIVAVNVVSRWEIRAKEWETLLSSPKYRQPKMWRIDSGNGNGDDIHPSRVICFRGPRLPSGSTLSDEDRFWGDSRLLRVYNEVTRSDQAQAWFAELIRKAKLLRIGIPDLLDMLSDPEGQQQHSKRVALIAQGESTLNATVYRSGSGEQGDGGEVIQDYQINWSGIPAMMDAFDQRVAAVGDIPFTRLMGRSPAGMNSTGQHDMDNWNKAVVSGQKLETRPCLEQLDPFLLRSAGADPAKVTWKFAPLSVPSEKEEADTLFTTTQALEKLQATGAIPDEAFAKAVQNLMVEREYFPGLDQALAAIPEDERYGLNPEDDGTDPSALQAGKEGDPASAGSGGAARPARRAVNDAWMLEDWAPKTLYVSRAVENRDDIVKWARSQGFTDIAEDLHVTITYSRTPVDWMAMGQSWRGKLEIEAGGPRLVEALGPDGKYKALLFTAYELVSRNQEMRDKGASFDWPEYQPHISIQVGGDIDLATVKPYTGKIVLGPEIFEEIHSGDS
jgi:hypothetical protein